MGRKEMLDKEKGLNKKVDELESEMEKLRTEEKILSQKIKEKHPNLSYKEIREEVLTRL